MANNGNNPIQQQTVGELQNRVEWLDEERRKLNRRLSELEQKLELKDRGLDGRDQRLQDLERQLTAATAQLSRIPQVDLQLAQFKDEIVQMIEQYDRRRIQSETEMDRRRRVEQEGAVRELAEIRKGQEPIRKLLTDMDMRMAEESRLGNLIGMQKTEIGEVRNRLEQWDSNFAFLGEKEKHNARNIAELQTAIVEINKRWEGIHGRLDTLNSALIRLENSLPPITERQEAIQHSTKNWMEQIQLGEYERNQKLENWRRILEEQTASLERFNKEWVRFSDQYKEAKMAVDTLTRWQEQIEKQQRESAELLRVETNRMLTRWDDFRQENDKRWKNEDVDREQRWATVNRHEREMREQITLLEEALAKLKEEKELLWRVQTAQADALKQWPRIWLEEVEKAIEQNPNRRRQPALVPVQEEFNLAGNQ
jgi:chromosome segregation ATPase